MLGPQCDNERGNPCNPGNGNKTQTEEDSLGSGAVLSLTRSYNSYFGKDVGWGFGWSSPFHKRLEINYVNLARNADGRGEPFTCTNGACTGDADTRLTINPDTTGYTLAFHDGRTERYSLIGKLLSGVNTQGQTTIYSYDTSGKLSTVRGAFGHTHTFGYNGNNHVASVTDPSGKTIQYFYDNINNLIQVNYPDNTAKLYYYEDANTPRGLTGIAYATVNPDGSLGNITRFSRYSYHYNSGNTTDINNGKAFSTEHAQTDNGSAQERFLLNYDSATQTTVTDPVGMNEVMTFATNLGVKNLADKVNPSDGKSVQQVFDANNNLTCKKDEENRVTLYGYNSTNQRTNMTEGLLGNCTSPQNTTATRLTSYTYLSPTLDLPTVIESPSVAGGTYRKRTTLSYGDSRFPALPTTITQSGYTPTGSSVARSVSLGYNSYGQVTSINGPRTDVSDVTALEYYECTTGGACGQMKKVTNALGHITTYDVYDANGRLLQMTDPNGLVTTYTYDPRGQVKTITRTPASGSAATTRYSYTPWGDVSQVIDPDGVVLNYQYDAAHDLRFIVDAAGNYIHYKYDLKGNRTGEDIYDAGGNLKRTTGYAYDLRNRLNQINNAGNITQLVHDAVGNLTRETDPNNNPDAQHTPDALNRLVQTIDRLGGTTAYGYDVNDRPTQVTPPEKSATQYVYDDLGNLLQEVSPDRNTTTYTYDAAGNLKTIKTARGPTVTYTYDALNRPILAAPGALPYRTTYVYDSCANGVGRLCAVTNSHSVVAYGYDGLGNITEHQSLLYTYTPAGRLKTMTYPSGAVVTYFYNVTGQVLRMRLTRNGSFQPLAYNIQYAPFGPVTSLNYGNGKTLAQTWDTAYRLSSQTVPGVLQLDYPQYDPNGNLRQRLDAIASQWSNFTYDPLDRLDAASGPFGGRDYDYDVNGNRTRLAEGTTVTSYSYAQNTNRLALAGTTPVTLDANGNITAQGARAYVYTSAFDHLTQALESGSQIAAYAYNALGQRVSKQTGGVITSYAYGLDGLLRVETTPNAAPREYVYLHDQPLAVMDQTLVTGTGTALAVTTVPALKNNNINVSWSGIAAPTALDWVGIYAVGSNDFAYLDWAYTNGGASGTASVTLNHPSLVAGGTYEARLYANDGYTLLAKSAPFVLNPAGPVVAVTSAQAVKGGGITVKWSGNTTPTTWDWVGIYAVGSDDYAYLDWAYTNGGASGTVNVTLNHPSIVADNTYEARLYANDGYTLIAKTPPFTVVANTGQSTPAALYYVHNDHLGTPQAMTDSSGTVVWKATYDPFGRATVTTGTVTNNLRLAGMYSDSETGLYYWGARYYDPKTGRGLSPDRMSVAEHVARWQANMGMPGQPPLEINPYVYVANNPLRWTDPSGEAIPAAVAACLASPACSAAVVAAVVTTAQVIKNVAGSKAANDAEYCPSSKDDGLCDNVGQYLLRRYRPGDAGYDPARPGVALYRCDYRCPNGTTFSKEIPIREGYGGCPARLPYSP
jgi:RHS repeat-associated protein